MEQSFRKGFTLEQRTEIWSRWRNGQTVSSISRALGKPPPSITPILKRHGGISPTTSHRSKLALTLPEREEISRGLAAGESLRTIAYRLKRSPSTISREIQRNGGYARYRATQAEQSAWNRARRPKPCKLAHYPTLRHLVAEKLQLYWSSEQIAGWLKHSYPNTEGCQVSHETIYRSLYVQTRGVLKKELQKYLRSKRSMRHGKPAHEERRGNIPNAISISERPASVEDRAVPGHWEGDLIERCKGTFIATLVERHSRYVMLVKVERKESTHVV